MVVYQIIEHTSWNEDFSWGFFSSEQKAKLYLKYENWDNNDDFEIVPYVLDERLKEVNCEELKEVNCEEFKGGYYEKNI